MILIKRLFFLVLFFQFQNILSQVKEITKPEEVNNGYTPSYYKTLNLSSKISDYKRLYIYEYSHEASNINLKRVQLNLKTNKKVDSSSIIIKTTGDIKTYNEDFTSFQKTNSLLTINKYLNYVVYKKKKKLGVILTDHIIPAKYDSIGKPFLVKGMKPMILVGIKKNNKMKLGIINSNGKSVLPIKYDEIIIPFDPDLKDIKNTKSQNLWVNVNSTDFLKKKVIGNYDGFYQNQKIIVKQNDKYGLFNADCSKVLNCEYDKITVNNNLDFYLLEKNKKFGFVMLRRRDAEKNEITRQNEPGILANSISKIMQTKDLILEPKLDFKVLREYKLTRSYFSFVIGGQKIRVNESEILKLLSKPPKPH
ncbi:MULTISPECIES: WG repeat-containing protein [unclassified Tenacibaculum]|uniref:WG repeat-containing protein n=1 Tax=unclassified Tenacibaculum TaxID=2635139 RepID=UPI001F1E5D91|nr:MULTISPECIES: WG repeat-containing protein [unclassified Tenacibaculum]MCF2875395.1 WG repeat-containing protein [Tenacibaculum sp. Cn5-1]MCF2935471.1 WG repeat-containing protein [Tenacibaculum sp. Cn5-34]MCG7512031.1 WG repeat-containing protein [Tenacibaculum sp. Cn5-46]